MTYEYLVSAALLLAIASPITAQSVKAGIDEWQKSNYSGAVAIWRQLAEEGDADAEFNLGQAYRLGRGVPTNPAAAKIWFERSANQGNVDAETTLGLLLFQSGDQSEGLQWLKKAADQGEPRAQLVYGTALVNGDSVTQDPALGYAYVTRAAGGGLEAAKDTLGQLDKLLPASSRKHGIALARGLGKGMPAPRLEALKGVTKVSQPPSTTSRAVSASKEKNVRDGQTNLAQEPPSKPLLTQKDESSKGPVKPESRGEKPAPEGKWRIQIGAFSKRSNGEGLFKRLADNPAIAGRQPYYVPNGAVTRLQVGPFESRSAADEACARLKSSCFAVPAK